MQEKIKYLLANCLEFIGISIMFLYSWLVSLLLKEKDVVVTFFILMMIDTVLGIIASIKRKIKITSIRLALFQFHSGSIKMRKIKITSIRLALFQFHSGSIKI